MVFWLRCLLNFNKNHMGFFHHQRNSLKHSRFGRGCFFHYLSGQWWWKIPQNTAGGFLGGTLRFPALWELFVGSENPPKMVPKTLPVGGSQSWSSRDLGFLVERTRTDGWTPEMPLVGVLLLRCRNTRNQTWKKIQVVEGFGWTGCWVVLGVEFLFDSRRPFATGTSVGDSNLQNKTMKIWALCLVIAVKTC